MSQTPSEVLAMLIEDWEDNYKQLSSREAMKMRQIRIKEFERGKLAPISKWPIGIRRIIFRRYPLPEWHSIFSVFAFLIGNGCSPYRAGTWLLTYYSLCDWRQKKDSLAKKMISGVISLYDKIFTGGDKMLTYWDLEENKVRTVYESKHLTRKERTNSEEVIEEEEKEYSDNENIDLSCER